MKYLPGLFINVSDNVSPATDWNAISIVASRAARLLDAFGEPAPIRPQKPMIAPEASTRGTETRILSMVAGEKTKAILTLRAVSQKLLNRSAALVQEGTKLKTVSPDHDQMLTKINLVFANALARSQSTWRIGITLTIVSFTVISAMLVAAVVLTLVTGKASWALIFGGTSVPLVIGTLLWKPYDMAFNATIRSQQIELIHIQVETVFKGTAVVDERVKTCDQAIVSLQSLYARDTSRVGGRSGTKKTRPKS